MTREDEIYKAANNFSNMDKEEKARKIMQEGLKQVNPIVVNVTELIMDAYQEGFKTCWKLLTGKDWDSIKEE